ncbi:MAG TPA: CBS domain-containing protein [Polyangiaceae bacterium]|nr:CBS domain-containing protein [Polyangiaceae bacterium]
MKVRELMTVNVARVASDEPLSSAARLMWDCDCGAVPVTDSINHRVIGILTDRDICMATWIRDKPPSEIPVREAMSRDLFYCSPDQSISSAESLMRAKQVRRIPVLDDDKNLLGILSLADIAKQSQREGLRGASALAPEEVSTTLAQICERRDFARAG